MIVSACINQLSLRAKHLRHHCLYRKLRITVLFAVNVTDVIEHEPKLYRITGEGGMTPTSTHVGMAPGPRSRREEAAVQSRLGADPMVLLSFDHSSVNNEKLTER